MSIRNISLAVFSICLGFAVSVSAEKMVAGAPDWAALAAIDTVDVVTTDEDGDVRETPIWLAVHEGVAYIRTSSGSSWGDNIERDGDIALRFEDGEYPLHASLVSDEALLDAVHATFRTKYGWFDSVAGVIRGSNPRIMQLAARAAE